MGVRTKCSRLGVQSRLPGGEERRHLSWECEWLEQRAREACSGVWSLAKAEAPKVLEQSQVCFAEMTDGSGR